MTPSNITRMIKPQRKWQGGRLSAPENMKVIFPTVNNCHFEAWLIPKINSQKLKYSRTRGYKVHSLTPLSLEPKEPQSFLYEPMRFRLSYSSGLPTMMGNSSSTIMEINIIC